MINKAILLLNQVPIFKHLMVDELSALSLLAKPHTVKKGSTFHCNAQSLYIVDKGIFGVQKSAESAYLSRTSYFGQLPFCEKGTGTVRALSDASVLELANTDLYQFICNNFKALRGYCKIVDHYRIPLSQAATTLLKNKACVFTIFSTDKHCGKTTLAISVAAACSYYKKTILLDASYDGISVFDMCGKPLIPPLSQKNPDDVTGYKFIQQRIEKISETMDIVNIAYGSKVKINPDIINPLLFYLSFEYSYIVIDCSNSDIHLRDVIMKNSDSIINVINEKSAINHQVINDTLLTQGQQVYNVVNKHFVKIQKIDKPSYVFKTIPVETNETIFQAVLKNKVYSDELFKNIASDKRAMVLSQGMYETLYYSGVLESLREEKLFDVVYANGRPYAVLMCYLATQTPEDYKKLLFEYFSDDTLHTFFDFTFPDKYLFKNKPLHNFASTISHIKRIEWNAILPYTQLMHNNTQRFFSTGDAEKIISANLAFSPLFEGISIHGDTYFSAFPLYPLIPESLLRTHINYIDYIAIANPYNPISVKSKIPGLYRKFVDFLPDCYLYACDNTFCCNRFISLTLPDVTSTNDLIKQSLNNADMFISMIK